MVSPKLANHVFLTMKTGVLIVMIDDESSHTFVQLKNSQTMRNLDLTGCRYTFDSHYKQSNSSDLIMSLFCIDEQLESAKLIVAYISDLILQKSRVTLNAVLFE